MDILINAANVLYLASYWVRDVLWLRVLTVIAASCVVPCFYFRPDPLLAGVYWNLFFIALNIWWIVRLVRARRGARARHAKALASQA
jgi:hypothetical protein